MLTWSTFDGVPAGDAFARRLGSRVARVNRTSELRLADVDWEMVNTWAQAGRERARRYRLEMVDGVFPDHLRADAAAFHHIMQTPLATISTSVTSRSTLTTSAELDRALIEAGRERWTCFVRDPHGNCVGGTEVTFEPWEPSTGLQQNTGIDPAHRGLGLAKWAKAAMLDRIRRDRPDAERVQTGNAFSNAPMLAINDALGFRVINTRSEWQADVAQVRQALNR